MHCILLYKEIFAIYNISFKVNINKYPYKNIFKEIYIY